MTMLGVEIYDMLERMRKTRETYPLDVIPTQNDTVEVEIQVSKHPNVSIRLEPREFYYDDLRALHEAYEDEHERDRTFVVNAEMHVSAARIDMVDYDDGGNFEPPAIYLKVSDLSDL